MNTKRNNMSVITIMMGLSLGVFNVALLSPALPSIKTYFNISTADSELVVIIFLAGYSLSQISFGPIANILGYKRSLFIGMLIGVLGALLCVASYFFKYFSLIIIGRFIEGFGASCGLALGFAIINELYKDKEARDVTTLGLMAAALIPALSNFVGGILVFHFGWISCFILLAIGNLIASSTCFLLPSSLDEKEKDHFSLRTILKGYSKALYNKKIVLGGIMYGMFLAIIYTTIGLLPFIGIDNLKLSPKTFGLLFLLSYLGYFTGTIISKLTTGIIKAEKAIFLGIIITVIGNIVFLISSLSGIENVYIVFICMYIIFLGLPFVFINASALSISSHDDKANGSSIFNFIYSLFALFSVLITQFVNINPIIVLPAIIIMLSVIGLLIFIKFITIKVISEP